MSLDFVCHCASVTTRVAHTHLRCTSSRPHLRQRKILASRASLCHEDLDPLAPLNSLVKER